MNKVGGLYTRCIGLYGLLFGHKFKYSTVEWVQHTDFCTRCGMPVGGWKNG